MAELAAGSTSSGVVSEDCAAQSVPQSRSMDESSYFMNMSRRSSVVQQLDQALSTSVEEKDWSGSFWQGCTSAPSQNSV